MPKCLILPVKKKWFEQIRDGRKAEEYRLTSQHWKKRIYGKPYDFVIITLGYPKKTDGRRRLVFRYQGYTIKNVISEEWDNVPREVFAIKLR